MEIKYLDLTLKCNSKTGCKKSETAIDFLYLYNSQTKGSNNK